MNNPNDGGPAFPLQDWDQCIHSRRTDRGMTLRDYFAAAALHGFCANPDHTESNIYETTVDAYRMADAMIAARDGKGDA